MVSSICDSYGLYNFYAIIGMCIENLPCVTKGTNGMLTYGPCLNINILNFKNASQYIYVVFFEQS
jgi:hypothetical protein